MLLFLLTAGSKTVGGVCSVRELLVYRGFQKRFPLDIGVRVCCEVFFVRMGCETRMLSDSVGVCYLVELLLTAALRTKKGDSRTKRTDRRAGVRLRRPKTPTPPVFPNGWIPVLESSELGRGNVKPLDVMGESLVAFRTSDGTAHVTAAHCPHLGAHFGAGGRVTGNCIECPFHGWKFDPTDGTCKNVPYSASVPNFVQLRTWKTSERLGVIFIWYHAEGEDPRWEIPDVPEITRDGWAIRSRSSYLVRCHIQDIVENEADLGHFGHLHAPPILLPEGNYGAYSKTFSRRFAEYRWDASWTSNGHVGLLDVRTGISILGYCPSLLQFSVSLQQVGPAFVVARIRSRFCEAVLLQSSTPEAPFRVRLVHRLFTGAGLGRLAAWYIAYFTKEMLERDIAVWNHKLYLKEPVLVKEDSSIVRYRKWFSQFYSDNSPTIDDVRERSLLDW